MKWKSRPRAGAAADRVSPGRAPRFVALAYGLCVLSAAPLGAEGPAGSASGMGPSSSCRTSACGSVAPEAQWSRLRQELERNPQSEAVRLRVADALMKQGAHQAAAAHLRQILGNKPETSLAFRAALDLSATYAEIGELEEAEKILKGLVTAEPDSPDARLALANVLAKSDKFAGAAREYKAALKIAPEQPTAALSLAKVHLRLGEYRRALSQLDACERLSVDAFEARYLRGLAWKGLGQFERSAEELEQAVRLAPNDYHVRYNLGFALARLGRFKGAVAQLQAAKRLDPEAVEARYQLAQVRRLQGNDELAAAELRELAVLKRETRDREAAAALANDARQLMESGRVLKAVELYREALSRQPRDPRLHFNLAVALRQQGDTEGQLAHLKRASELDLDFAAAHNELGRLRVRQQKWAAAEKHFLQAIRRDPFFSGAQNNLGALYVRLGRVEDAARLFRQAIASNPENVHARINLGLALASRGELLAAAQELLEAIRLSPDEPRAQRALAMVRRQQGGKTR